MTQANETTTRPWDGEYARPELQPADYPERLLAAARAYATAGHPIMLVRPNKRPWGKFKERIESGRIIRIETMDRWLRVFNFVPIGLITGLTADVFDVEVHGLEAIAHLPMPKCPTAITARGGRHYYFKPGTLVHCGPIYVGELRIADIKTRGGYVLLPPSYSMNGPYEWEPGLALDEVELPAPPEWILELRATRKLRRRTPRGDTRAFPRSPHTRAQGGVTPLGVVAPDRSSEDLTAAIYVLAGGGDDEDVLDTLVQGGAYQDRLARGHGDYYLRVTLDAAHEYIDENFFLCMVRRTAQTPGEIEIGFTVLEGPHAGRDPHLGVLDYPPTDRSRNRWRALSHATGVAVDVFHPRARDKRLRVEVLGEVGGFLRCGRFLPPDE